MESNVTISWNQVEQWLSVSLHAWIVGGLALLYVLGFCAIFSRAGWPFALGLLMAVPGLNLILFLVFAFGPWPSLGELYRLRRLDTAVKLAGKRYSSAA